ncbi:MAG: insulinase family protein, partial [bacterium]|nr:insulinase family protein [bacterium]
HIETSIDILSDMIRNALFDPEDIEKERNVIIEEINMYRDIPARHVYELLDSVMFVNHPLGTSGLGTPETLRNINRKDLITYTNTFHTGRNIVASFVGKLDENELLRLAETYLGTIPEGEKTSFQPFKEFQKNNRYNIKKKDTEQCHFCIGFYAYPREDKRKFPLAVANTILGGNMSSRLFNEVRENRGLVYDIRSQTKSFYDTGAIIISAGLKPENLNECLKIIKDQLNIIMDEKVREEEISRAKEFLVSQFLMGLEDTMEYMLWIGEQKATRTRMLSIKEVEENIRSVTVDDIQKVCREIFSGTHFFAMISPEDKSEDVFKIMEVGK